MVGNPLIMAKEAYLPTLPPASTVTHLQPIPESLFRMSNGEERIVRWLPRDVLAHFIGRRCWAGVDLSMTTDTTGIVFIFPCEGSDTYDVLPFCWLPSAKVRKLQVKLGVPLNEWIRDGFLETCEGGCIDLRDIRARLEWAAKMFDLQEICWDPWNSRQLSTQMMEHGFKCVEIRQGYQLLNEPTKKILELVSRDGLHHGGHPVMRWHAGSACTVTDGKDNIMFDKPSREKGTARIDLLAAANNAMSRVLVAAPQATPGFMFV